MTTKESVKNLWKNCFDDEEAFITLYFEKLYRDELNYVLQKDGKIISALQALPYELSYLKGVLSLSYISGACTTSEYRQQGYMRELLSITHRAEYDKGTEVCALIPANDSLWEYYRNKGYATAFFQQTEVYSVASFSKKTDKEYYSFRPLSSFSDTIYDFIKKQLEKRSCTILYSLPYLEVVMEDLHLAGGEVLACYRGDRLAGVAFWINTQQETAVKELVTEDTETKQILLQEILRLSGQSNLTLVAPAITDQERKGMARVINAEKILSRYARHFSDQTHFLHIDSDETIPENNGYYIIKEGQCIRGYSPHYHYTTLSVSQLIQFLFADQHPFMSLMLE
ncbi:MAG: GNAT family N-acetyltransferase [Bacteroidales bacterium]